MILNVDRRR